MSDKQIVTCCGMDMPLLADLGDGCWLVGHPNGPAVGAECTLQTLHLAAFVDDMETVHSRAIDAYVDLTWPLLQKQGINAELLEALEIALPYVEQACASGDYINDEEFMGFAALLSVEAAIAKAKGES